MFPLNDTEPNRYSWFPFMTISLIAINTFIEIAKPLYLPDNMTLWQILGIHDAFLFHAEVDPCG